MKFHTILFAGLTLLYSCSNSSSSELNNDCSSLKFEDNQLVINNYYFKNIDKNKVLAVHSFQQTWDSLAIPSYKLYPVHPKVDSASWTLEFDAEDFQIQKNLLTSEVSLPGFDATFALYNLDFGVKLLDYTYDKFEILFFDDLEKRFLGFYSSKAANIEKSDFSFDKQTLGFFSYANLQGDVQTLEIKLTKPEVPDSFDLSNPVIELKPKDDKALELKSGKTLYFTGSNGKEKSEINFDIFITFYSLKEYTPHTFQLEVKSDKMQAITNNSDAVFQIVAL